MMNPTRPLNTAEIALAGQRERVVTLLLDAARTLAEMSDSAAEDRARLLDMGQDLREQFFLVVVIGEFNAGKSTFINALLHDELLEMGITPTTEAIHMIRYGEEPQRTPTPRPDGVMDWAHPNTGAPGVALVDTPGTGSVFKRHEQTAKSFLHRSDLVIFVISAKRAFAETERLYLELARDYGKKIILVINQADLLEPAERGQVRRFVERQVEELLDLKPPIFMVSAREALKGARDAEGDPHGIEALRAHLNGLFSEMPPARQKLLAQLVTAERIMARYQETAKGSVDLVSADRARLEDIQQELGRQSTGLGGQLAAARAQVDAVFEAMRLRGMLFINQNLSIRNLMRPVSREVLQQRFQDEVIGRALHDVSEASSNYINALIDNSRAYWRDVIDRLNQLQRLLEQELPGLDAGIYAEQREALQEAVRLAESELKTYSTGRAVAGIQETFQHNLNNFALSSGAALVGLIAAILGIAAPGGVLTGATSVLVAPAVLIGLPVAVVGGVVAVRYLLRVSTDAKRELNARVDALLQSYHAALDELTAKERERLAGYGSRVLMPLFSRLSVLSDRYRAQLDTLSQYRLRLDALRREIEAMG
jgi:small GTP-binding protein